jgi:hypothetical protein
MQGFMLFSFILPRCLFGTRNIPAFGQGIRNRASTSAFCCWIFCTANVEHLRTARRYFWHAVLIHEESIGFVGFRKGGSLTRGGWFGTGH